MIIPVRCFTCGKVIGDKWELFAEYVRDRPESFVTVSNNLPLFLSVFFSFTLFFLFCL